VTVIQHGNFDSYHYSPSPPYLILDLYRYKRFV
jgi:hypothetical protein